MNPHTCHWSVVRFPLPQVTSSDSCEHTPVKQCLMGRSQYDTGIERTSSFPSTPLGHGHSFLKSTLRKGHGSMHCIGWSWRSNFTPFQRNIRRISNCSCVKFLGRIISKALGLVSQLRRWPHSCQRNGFLMRISIPCLLSLGIFAVMSFLVKVVASKSHHPTSLLMCSTLHCSQQHLLHLITLLMPQSPLSGLAISLKVLPQELSLRQFRTHLKITGRVCSLIPKPGLYSGETLWGVPCPLVVRSS